MKIYNVIKNFKLILLKKRRSKKCSLTHCDWLGSYRPQKIILQRYLAKMPEAITPSKTPYVAIDERGVVRSIHLLLFSCVH